MVLDYSLRLALVPPHQTRGQRITAKTVPNLKKLHSEYRLLLKAIPQMDILKL